MRNYIFISTCFFISSLTYAQVPNIEWQKCLGGSGTDDASSIQQTTDGGYIVAGTTTSNDGDVSANHGGGDIWIVKLSDSMSVNSFKSNSLKITPNPTTSYLTVLNPKNIKLDKIIITDLAGKIVINENGNSNQIYVEKLPNGVYIIHIICEEGEFTHKFIKK